MEIVHNDFILDGKNVRELWGNGKPLSIYGDDFLVHKMSYGDYFLEPTTWKGGELDGFSPETIWLEKVAKKDLYVVDRVDVK